jgi:hypothetical protein
MCWELKIIMLRWWNELAQLRVGIVSVIPFAARKCGMFIMGGHKMTEQQEKNLYERFVHWTDIDTSIQLWQYKKNGRVYVINTRELRPAKAIDKDFIKRYMLHGIYPETPMPLSYDDKEVFRYLLLSDERRKDKRLYGCYNHELLANRQSRDDRSKEIQEKLAESGVFALVMPRLGKKGGNIIGYRILNKFLKMDKHIGLNENIEELAKRIIDTYSYLDEFQKTRYYSWCKCLAQRPEWLKDERYREWADKYRMYKCEKLLG